MIASVMKKDVLSLSACSNTFDDLTPLKFDLIYDPGKRTPELTRRREIFSPLRFALALALSALAPAARVQRFVGCGGKKYDSQHSGRSEVWVFCVDRIQAFIGYLSQRHACTTFESLVISFSQNLFSDFDGFSEFTNRRLQKSRDSFGTSSVDSHNQAPNGGVDPAARLFIPHPSFFILAFHAPRRSRPTICWAAVTKDSLESAAKYLELVPPRPRQSLRVDRRNSARRSFRGCALNWRAGKR